jgi:serine/threonine protein kinase
MRRWFDGVTEPVVEDRIADGNPGGEGSPVSSSSAAEPRSEPRYQALAEIGRGGMGRVLEALDRKLGRTVAIKELLADDDDGRRRFAREVAITARLEHPSIVPLYDSGMTASGQAFYVMRKLSGRGLDQAMSELGSLDARLTLLPALLAACDAVAHAHARRVVHRDLKPGNILVGDHGETTVIDWGLAKAIGDSEPPRTTALSPAGAARPDRRSDGTADSADLDTTAPAPQALPSDDLKTVVGSVFGTPGFMSPEQARGEDFDMRGDVYALGATLYHLLAGRPPHVGSSATEVIDLVGMAPPPPLLEVCPGAPVELIAIAEKAMAFDMDARYPDAAALAGDLRRFLAGQLVAAHRYTRWQRVRRSARAYRGPLLVAATALLVVTALGIVSVRRIISERDQARQAREIATQETRVAQAARDQAAMRADELVVAQAHALVTENPTAAAALLKRLAPQSALWPKARMVVMAALAEGVARAVPGTSTRPPAVFAMNPQGDTLLVGESSGRMWTLDLERMRARELVNLGGHPYGCWVHGGAAVLLVSEATGVIIRDIDSGQTRTVPTSSAVSSLACSANGSAAYLDRDGAAWLLDASFAQARRLETGLIATTVAVSPDGEWITVGGARGAVVLDRDGGVRRRLSGEVIRIESSARGRFAVMMRDRVVEFDPALATPAIESQLLPYSIAIYFIGENLRVLRAGNRLRSPDGQFEVELPATAIGSAAIGDHTTALGLGDGSVWLSGWWGARVMRSPAFGPLTRVAGVPGRARLAAWSRGTVLVWNLGAGLPSRLSIDDGVARLVFLGEDRLAAIGNSTWQWIDLLNGRIDRVDQPELPMFNELLVDPDRGDAVLIDSLLGRALLLRWSNKSRVRLWTDRVCCAALLGDGSIAIGRRNGQFQVGDPEKDPQTLTLGNPLAGLLRLGSHGVLAVDSEGELLSYDRPTATMVRATLGESPSGPMVDDGDGGAVIALGTRLVRWHKGQVHELARLGEPVIRLTRYRQYLAVLTSSELSTIDLSGDRTASSPDRTARGPSGGPPARAAAILQRIAATSREQQLADGSRWSIGVGQRGLIELVDIATGVRWSKSIHGGFAMFAVSPGGSRIAQLLGRDIALWSYSVPEPSQQLRAWLDQLTNAVVDANLDVVWTAGP